MRHVIRYQHRWVFICATSMMVVSGCASSSPEGHGSGSCARRIMFEDRIYTDAAGPDVTTDGKLGSTTLISCDDASGDGKTGNAEKPEMVTIYQVEGLDSSLGVAVGNSAEDVDLFALEQTGDLPDEVQEFIDQSQPRASTAD